MVAALIVLLNIYAGFFLFLPVPSHAAEFPKEPVNDYDPVGYQAKILFPFRDGLNARIWVKGSSGFRFVKIADTKKGLLIYQPVQLTGPFFTKTFEIDSGVDEVTVLFSNDNSSFEKSVALYPKSSDYFLARKDDFSILFYGCFQPFEVKDRNNIPKASLISGKFGEMNYLMRNLFHAVATGAKLNYEERYRARKNNPGKTFFGSMPAESWFGRSQVSSAALISEPRLIVGTGDQVYVDAGFEYKGSADAQPISAWDDSSTEQYKKNPVLIKPIRDIMDAGKKQAAIDRFMNDMYLHFYSFNTLNDLFARIPSVSAWDDHEIRDGWGSHGDEYLVDADGQLRLNPEFAQFYNTAKKAYIQHQYITGPISRDTNMEKQLRDNISLQQEFEVSGIKGFMFDLRSNRFIKDQDEEHRVIGRKQMEQFENWGSKLERGETVLIISTMPVFFGHSSYARKLTNAATGGATIDDFNDDWSSDANRAELKKLVEIMIRLREEKDIKPVIISGDKHMGAMIEVWYTVAKKGRFVFWKKFHKRKDRKVLAYELVASGLSHEIPQLRYKLASEGIRLSEAGQIGENTIRDILIDGNNFKVDPTVRSSRVRLNFGALEFRKNDRTRMHMFAANDANTGVEERIMNLDWAKTNKDEIKWETTTWKQKIKNLFYLWIMNKSDYTAAPVDAMRTISYHN